MSVLIVDPPLRVVMVTYNWRSTIGGITRYVDTLTNKLRGYSDVNVSIVAPDPKAADDFGITVSGNRITLSITTYRALKKLKPHIIHCHDNPWMALGCLMYRWLHPSHCRFVFSLHTQFNSFPAIGWVHKMERFVYQKLRKLLYELFVRSVDCMTAVSKAMAADVMSNKIVIIPFGVECRNPTLKEISEFKNKFNLCDANPIIMSIGVFYHEWKVIGFEVLMSAFAALVKHFPSAKLVIVGDGQWRTRLLRYATLLDLRKRVVFTGYQNDIAPILASCDVYAHLALNEALGFAVAEAMYFGKPVLGANLAGIPELIQQGETGILVAPDPAEATTALKWILSDTERAKILGRRAQRVIAQHFNWTTVTEQFLAIYRRLAVELKMSAKK